MKSSLSLLLAFGLAAVVVTGAQAQDKKDTHFATGLGGFHTRTTVKKPVQKDSVVKAAYTPITALGLLDEDVVVVRHGKEILVVEVCKERSKNATGYLTHDTQRQVGFHYNGKPYATAFMHSTEQKIVSFNELKEQIQFVPPVPLHVWTLSARDTADVVWEDFPNPQALNDAYCRFMIDADRIARDYNKKRALPNFFTALVERVRGLW